MKCYRNIRRIICFMLACPVLVGLFGCGKSKTYTADEIASFSISCGHMNYMSCYGFNLIRDNGVWLFSANCFTDGDNPRVEFENAAVADEDVTELFKIIREEETIAGVLEYRKPLFKPFVADKTMYSTYITFADGVSINAPIRAGNAIEKYFYSLAAKYSVTEE